MKKHGENRIQQAAAPILKFLKNVHVRIFYDYKAKNVFMYIGAKKQI